MADPAAEARAALERFIEAWNSSDLEAVRATLNYPHVTFTPAGEVIVANAPAEFTASFERLRATERWHHSALERWEVLGESERSVQIAVDVTRHHEDGSRYASGRLLYIVTEHDGRWGMQFRTPLDRGGLTSGR
jgi:ketosteroid isomerase-like protein